MSRSTLTDPLTGLPNARFLWLEAAQRAAATDRPGATLGEPYGVIAFRVGRLGDVVAHHGSEVAERGLVQIAQRLAGACAALETVVRFGHDLFVVLSPGHDGASLIDRWHHMVEAAEALPLETPSDPEIRLRLVAAHASYPADGDDLDALFDVLEARLDHCIDDKRTVVPFHRRLVAVNDTEPAAEKRPV